MKKGKMLQRLAAVMLAGTMMMAMGTTVFAEDAPNGNVTGNVSFTKTLDMSQAEGASVPDVTFSYIIGAGEAVPASDTTPEILSGTEAAGLLTVESAAYTHEDAAAAEVEKTVNVDFSNVTFSKPGIYRYVITEQTTNNADITNDGNPTRYLDVYVVNGGTEGTYAIDNFVLLPSAITPDNNGVYGDGSTSKSSGYTNMYTTYQLSLDKVVSGTMGNHGETFTFAVKFFGPTNASFKYGETTVTLDENIQNGIGEKEVTGISIKEADDPVVIQGIPSTVQYEVKEIIASTKGYTTSYKVNDVDKTAASTAKDVTMERVTMGKVNNAVVCTNVKNAVTPTGIVMNIAPYVLMVAVAAVLAVVFLRKRNDFEN